MSKKQNLDLNQDEKTSPPAVSTHDLNQASPKNQDQNTNNENENKGNNTPENNDENQNPDLNQNNPISPPETGNDSSQAPENLVQITNNAPENQNPDLSQSNTTSPPKTENNSKQTPENKEESPLFSLAILADKFRVASWQEAALLRMVGWTLDKKVSETDYKNALAQLSSRRIGGGRN